MLALSRKKDEAIVINNNVEITIIEIKGERPGEADEENLERLPAVDLAVDRPKFPFELRHGASPYREVRYRMNPARGDVNGQ